ncbi:MAG: DUF2029 domain-containing protein [Acidobacteriales bacterium]|nr:DUF2029 domain-containing protein [Terriglobales bacterium]
MLGICLWLGYAWDMSGPGLLDRVGQPKGGDFPHFYVLGQLVRAGRADLLYDMAAQSRMLAAIIPEKPLAYVPLYGPQVSLLFAPLATLPYGTALAVWDVANILLYTIACWLVWRRCPFLQRERATVLVLAAALPGFFSLIAWGQTSGLALLLMVLGWLAWRDERYLLAGVAFGSLVFKPQLFVPAAAVLLLAGPWRVAATTLASALLQLVFTWQRFGTAVMQQYAHALIQTGRVMSWIEPRPWATHSSRAFFTMLAPRPWIAMTIYALFAIAIVALAVTGSRRHADLNQRFAILLLATLLLAPHLGIADLVILAPVILLMANWARGNPGYSDRFAWPLCAVYATPLLGWTARWTHLQLSVAAMAWLFWVCVKSEGRDHLESPEDLPA